MATKVLGVPLLVTVHLLFDPRWSHGSRCSAARTAGRAASILRRYDDVRRLSSTILVYVHCPEYLRGEPRNQKHDTHDMYNMSVPHHYYYHLFLNHPSMIRKGEQRKWSIY